MTPLYRIVDWDGNFEVASTKKRKHLQWVPIPCKLDGDGYTELVSTVRGNVGAAHYGAWMALICVASRCQPRGTLIRANGTPHEPCTLARITRLPAAIYHQVLPRLVSIGWIEVVGESANTSAESANTVAELGSRARVEGRKEGRKEGGERACARARGAPLDSSSGQGDPDWRTEIVKKWRAAWPGSGRQDALLQELNLKGCVEEAARLTLKNLIRDIDYNSGPSMGEWATYYANALTEVHDTWRVKLLKARPAYLLTLGDGVGDFLALDENEQWRMIGEWVKGRPSTLRCDSGQADSGQGRQ